MPREPSSSNGAVTVVERAAVWSAGSVAVAVFVAAIAAAWGWFDAVLVAAPFVAVAIACTVPPPTQRRWRRQFVVLTAAAFAVSWWLGHLRAIALAGGVRIGSLLPHGALLLGFVLTLRACVAGVHGLAAGSGLRPRAAACVGAVVTVAVLPPLLVCVLQCHQVAVTTAVATAVPHVEVEFAAADGTPLRGTLLRQPSARAGVVVCHGLGANRANVLGIAERVHELGYQVLLFDARGHGDSGGLATTLGAREAADVRAAIDVLQRDPFTTAGRVGLIGVSMGGAAVLLAAAADARCGAVFVESGFADLDAMIATRVAALPAALRRTFVAATCCWARLSPGIDVAAVSPRTALAQLSADVPVVVVHGAADTMIPLAQGVALAAARPGLRCDVFAGAVHAGCFAADPSRYAALLARVLRRGLGEVR